MRRKARALVLLIARYRQGYAGTKKKKKNQTSKSDERSPVRAREGKSREVQEFKVRARALYEMRSARARAKTQYSRVVAGGGGIALRHHRQHHA